jgi:hypothetical protein
MSDLFDWMQAEAAMHEKVAKLKADGVDPVTRAEMTAEDRKAVLRGRADAFQAGTQQKGRPTTYGHGSRERYLKETKG